VKKGEKKEVEGRGVVLVTEGSAERVLRVEEAVERPRGARQGRVRAHCLRQQPDGDRKALDSESISLKSGAAARARLVN